MSTPLPAVLISFLSLLRNSGVLDKCTFVGSRDLQVDVTFLTSCRHKGMFLINNLPDFPRSPPPPPSKTISYLHSPLLHRPPSCIPPTYSPSPTPSGWVRPPRRQVLQYVPNA
ncbi:unnamed protein product, partial [Discosporangium mesarthrocarpum]